MEIAGIDDDQVTFRELIFCRLNDCGELSFDQIENFHLFVPVRRKNKSGRILQLKTDMQQIGFVYSFVKAGFHDVPPDVVY